MSDIWNAACRECPAAVQCYDQLIESTGNEAGSNSLLQSAIEVQVHLQSSYQHRRSADALGGSEEAAKENKEILERVTGRPIADISTLEEAQADVDRARSNHDKAEEERVASLDSYTELAGNCPGPRITRTKRLGSFTIIRCASENKDDAPWHKRIKIRKTTFADRYIDAYGEPN